MTTSRTRTWEECGLLWWAKGYKLDAIAPEFEKHFGADSKFGRTTLGDNAKTQEVAPPAVVEFVWSDELLPVLPGASKLRYEVVRRGLDADGPVDATGVAQAASGAAATAELREALEAIRSELKRVADKLAEGPDDVHGAWTSSATKLDAIEAKQDQASETLEIVRGKVDASAASLNAIRMKQDEVAESQDTIHTKIDRLFWAVLGGGVGLGIGFVLMALVLMYRAGQEDAAQSASAHAPVRDLIVNIAPGLFDTASGAQPGDGPGLAAHSLSEAGATSELGKAPAEKWVPSAPLDGQMRGPCKTAPGYEEINGGCWVQLGLKPPCGDFYRRGDRCYVPIWATRPEPVTHPSHGLDGGTP
jgi:hypothetical protein